MTTDFMICNRKKPRWSMTAFEDASMELDVGSVRCRFTVLDVSSDGISFFVPADAPELEASYGADALVRVDETEIRGEVRIVHVTPAAEGGVCGATFRPMSELDERDWQNLIDDLAAADRGPIGRSV